MRIVCIIQARMGSTRLPGKVLEDLGGHSMLARTIRRAQRAPGIADTVVATTTAARDDAVVEACAALGVGVFRGSELDVLDRYYGAARDADAEAVCRITSDCPFIDPDVIGMIARAFEEARPDYASNTLERTWPRGLDAEVFTMDALARAWTEAEAPFERVHVTPYIHRRPDRFNLLSVEGQADHSAHRWTVDTEADLRFARAAYALVDGDDTTPWSALLAALERAPEVSALNRAVEQKKLEEG